MKIINNKGKKEFVSTFFHSKDTEKQFRKYFILFSFILGFLFFITSLLIFVILDDWLLSIPLVLVLGIVLYILKDRYITSIVQTVMNYAKSKFGEKNEVTSKYPNEKKATKTSKLKLKFSKMSYKVKDKYSKKKDNESSYIEIK